MSVTWPVLELRGWKTRLHPLTNRMSYTRPSGGIVNARRDLTEQEKNEFGDTLFPFSANKGQRRRLTIVPLPVSDPPASTSSVPAQAHTALPTSDFISPASRSQDNTEAVTEVMGLQIFPQS